MIWSHCWSHGAVFFKHLIKKVGFFILFIYNKNKEESVGKTVFFLRTFCLLFRSLVRRGCEFVYELYGTIYLFYNITITL